ncbi:MAG: L-seryl-tRNA(Sec) selenium transferase [Lacipirellulaceae bacterium]
MRNLPSVSALLEVANLQGASQQFGKAAVTRTARQVVHELREKLISANHPNETILNVEAVAELVSQHLNTQESTRLQPVINATGILLHTGLGRAPLPSAAVHAVTEAAQGYCNVELELASGERTRRSAHVADLLCELTGAEAAHVVNNNAGATALVLAALATDREVIVSHGELIEIGGGYRLPEVMETFGAKLRPVGTTNKTRAGDYEAAITEQTGALLVVHTSNYAIRGFTETPPVAQIAELAHRNKLPLVHDVGSGALLDFAQFGCHSEPVAADSIQAGADLVLFSGDKLLGGPQAGIIVGGQQWIERVVAHPLNRALRVDKTTLAALRATLQLYRQPESVTESIPLLGLLSTPVEELQLRAEKLAESIRSHTAQWGINVEEDEAYLGGGSVPDQSVASRSVSIDSDELSVDALAKALRTSDPSVVPRVHNGQLLLNLRSVLPVQDEPLAKAVIKAARSLNHESNE